MTKTSAQTPAQSTDDEYISLMDLYKSGMTAGMAWHLLGHPQKSETGRPFPKNPHMQYYLRNFVASATEGRKFQCLRIIDILSRIRNGEDNMKYMTEWAETVPIRTGFQEFGWDDIVQLGCLDRWSYRGFFIQPHESSEGMRALWGYTFLKHNCTNYDELCDLIKGKMFSRYAYPILLHRFNRAILDRFPQCVEKVKGLRKNQWMTCPTCRRTERAIHNGHYFTKPEGWLYQLSDAGHYIRVFCSRECTKARRGVPRSSRWHKLQDAKKGDRREI